MTKIQIMSRTQIEEFSIKGFQPSTMVISIRDCATETADLKSMPKFLLQLAFNDVNGDIFLDAFGNPLSHKEKLSAINKYHPINGRQASRLAEFYFEHASKAKIIICQCEYGESRSSAIASAIAEYECHDGLRYFIDDKYCPNKFVFRKIYNVLRRKGATVYKLQNKNS